MEYVVATVYTLKKIVKKKFNQRNIQKIEIFKIFFYSTKQPTMPCQHDNTCCICLNHIPRSYPTLSCGHKIHPKCMRKWNKTCPLCRKEVQIIPFTRREEAAKKIYQPLDSVLDPLWRATVYWRSHPDTRDESNVNDIWKGLDILLNFIWKNRNVLRRDYKFIDTMKKRSYNLITSCHNNSSDEWSSNIKNKQLTRKFKYILARI